MKKVTKEELNEIRKAVSILRNHEKKAIEILLNDSFGGFSIPEKVCERLGVQYDGYGFNFNDDRANPELIELWKNEPELFYDEKTKERKNLKIEEVLVSEICSVFIDNWDGIESLKYQKEDFGDTALIEVI